MLTHVTGAGVDGEGAASKLNVRLCARRCKYCADRTDAPQLPADIQWHFIGHLQSNKVKKLLKVTCQSLHVLETVDSLALATTLDKALAALDTSRALNVFVQVNTSGETGAAIFSSIAHQLTRILI